MQEGKVYFVGKYKLYRFKTEVSAIPDGLAIGCTRHYPGSTSDWTIFQEKS